jgi:Protein of unknown function DUF262
MLSGYGKKPELTMVLLGSKKWSVLWDDVMSHYGSDEKTSHFLGAVVSIPVKTVPVGVTKHLMIDGQKRLTTLAIILTALRDSADTKTAVFGSVWRICRDWVKRSCRIFASSRVRANRKAAQ